MFIQNKLLARYLYFLFLSIILIAAAFNMFYNLGMVPIDSWDEARHGISAYEMVKNGNYIVNTYAFQRDYWNLKPPVSFWAIILGYKIAGFNPLGLRLFSAAAALLTIMLAAVYAKNVYGRIASLVTALVLTTSTQYILSHSARTGDADALHVLFFTLAVISIGLTGKNKLWLYAAGLSFSVSFLTKSWHSVNIAVIIFLYIFLSKLIFKMKISEWLFFTASSAAPIFAWGIFRYRQDGLAFFKAMIEYDLLARSSQTLEGHIGGPSYYLLTLQYSLAYWLLILIACFILYLLLLAGNDKKTEGNSALLLLLWISVPLLFYTVAKTKITWYILPLYPALAICTGALTSKIVLSLGRVSFIRWVIVSCVIVTSCVYEFYIFQSISNVKTDKNQKTLQYMSDIKNYRGINIYTMDVNREYPACWRQCDLLAAELYGGLKPSDGGLEAFMKHKGRALIMVPKSPKYMDMLVNKNLRIVVDDSVNLILSK